MNDSREHEARIFTEALAFPAADRPRFPVAAGGNDAALRQRIEELLHAHDSIGEFMTASPARLAPARLVMTTLVVALVIGAGLVLSGCSSMGGILLYPVVKVAAEVPGRLHAESLYKANYANSDAATINGLVRRRLGLSFRSVSILYVDGHDADQAGYPYWRFKPVFISPGSRRVAVRAHTSLLGRVAFSELEFIATARHAYRINAEKVGDEIQLQLWDETDGAAEPIRVTDVRQSPAVLHLDELLLKYKPDSAVIVGDEPLQFNNSGDKTVYLRLVDGNDLNSTRNPYLPFNRWCVVAGTHHLVVNVQGAFWWLESRISPPVEITIAAQHVYRVTAKETNHVVLLQFWDETAGADQRKLLKEIPLVSANS